MMSLAEQLNPYLAPDIRAMIEERYLAGWVDVENYAPWDFKYLKFEAGLPSHIGNKIRRIRCLPEGFGSYRAYVLHPRLFQFF